MSFSQGLSIHNSEGGLFCGPLFCKEFGSRNNQINRPEYAFRIQIQKFEILVVELLWSILTFLKIFDLFDNPFMFTILDA